jgi:hypothetical protein
VPAAKANEEVNSKNKNTINVSFTLFAILTTPHPLVVTKILCYLQTVLKILNSYLFFW